MDGHLRALPGAIDGKKPQARDVQAVEVMVGITEELPCLLVTALG